MRSSWLSARRAAAVLAGLPEAVVAVDQSATILWASAGATLFGHKAADLVGMNGLELIDPRDVETAAAAMLRTLDAGGVKQPWPLRVIGRDARSRWVEMAPANLLDDPEVGAVLISIRPLEGRDAQEAEWRSLEELFRRAFDDAPIGMALLSTDRRLTRINNAFCELLQQSQLDLLGTGIDELTQPEDLEIERPLLDALLAGDRRSYVVDKRLLRPDGSATWVTVGVSLVRGDAGDPERFVVHVQDIADRKASEASLAHRATHDMLTGLPNRALFEDRLAVALARAERTSYDVAVLFCDLDGFKAVNDQLGHDAGDAVLAEVAARMTGAVRGGDTVARLGGDEFVVLCEDLAPGSAELNVVVDRLVNAVGLPVHVGDEDVTLRLSVGRAVSGVDDTPRALLQRADAAMYEAKAAAAGGQNAGGD